METIGEQALWSFDTDCDEAQVMNCTAVRKSQGFEVHSYLDLANRIADLNFRNRDSVLLFRGQSADYRNAQQNTTLKPSLFRSRDGRNPSPSELISRFEKLRDAEFILTEEYRRLQFSGAKRVARQQMLRWAILQHYEVCDTPLLDVTRSLRIAASFASADGSDLAYIFVVGVPNLSGAVTASAEAGIQTIRLSSVCPPIAARPHIQEGYLIGEYPEMTGYDQKRNYAHYEIDFGRRLVAKFYFNPMTFWDDDLFPIIRRSALYPDATDSFSSVARRVQSALQSR